MIGLVEALDGSFSLDDVKSVTNVPPRPGRAERYVVELRSGGADVSLFAHEYVDLMARPVQLLPAATDTVLLTPFVDSEGAHIDGDPVLAWALCFDGQVRALTPGGVRPQPRDFVGLPYIRRGEGDIREFGPGRDRVALTSIGKLVEHVIAERDRVAQRREPTS